MTKEALEIEPGKPFAAAVITIRVKIPEKTDTAVLSLSGDGDSIIMLEKQKTLPFAAVVKTIAVVPSEEEKK